MKLEWPEPDYDVAEQRKRLEEESSEKTEESSSRSSVEAGAGNPLRDAPA